MDWFLYDRDLRHERVNFKLRNKRGLKYSQILANIYLFKVSDKNTRKRYEIFSKLTIKKPERRNSCVFIVNLEHIANLFLVLLLLI